MQHEGSAPERAKLNEADDRRRNNDVYAEGRLAIKAFDAQKLLQHMRLLIVEDIPKEKRKLEQRLALAWGQKSQGGATAAVQVSTECSHPKWKKILQKEIQSQKPQI